MKICLINNLYKPFARGGAENIIALLAKGLQSHGIEVFIISTKPYNSHPQDKKSGIRIYFLPSFYYNLHKIPKVLRIGWHLFDMFDLITTFKVAKILKKEKPDLVITNNLKGISYLLPFLIEKLRIKQFHILHDIQLLHPSGLMIYGKENKVNTIFARVYQFICRRLFNKINFIISPSAWLLNEHTRRGFFSLADKKVIPNPVLLENYDKFIKKDIIKGKKENIKFFYAGQIESHKGVLFLIESFQKFIKINGKGAILIIAGQGSALKRAKKLAGNYLNKKIFFLGQVDKDKLKNLMLKSDCLIVPSLCYENQPTVILEASVFGLPIIASRLAGISELIHNLGGVLFNPSDSDDLVKKMVWTKKNYTQLIHISDRNLIKIKEYNLNKYLDFLENI